VVTALEAADRAEAEGRLLDAIDALQRANRLATDPDLERRLVRLRGEAPRQFDPGAGRDHWPPHYPDLFQVEAGALPEIEASALTTEVLGSGITHHGALLVRGLFTPALVEQFVDGIDRAFDAFDRAVGGTPPSKTAPWYIPFQPSIALEDPFLPRRFVRAGGGVWFADSPHMMFELADLFERTGLRDIIAGYLGERPATSVKKCTLRRVPIDSQRRFHQDGAFMGQDLRTVNTWIALSECGGDSSPVPALDVVPRRFDDYVETGGFPPPFTDFVSDEVTERVAAGVGITRPRFSPGDALLFDDLLLHATYTRPDMIGERYAIEAWFFAPSHIPADQSPLAF